MTRCPSCKRAVKTIFQPAGRAYFRCNYCVTNEDLGLPPDPDPPPPVNGQQPMELETEND